MGFLIDKLEKRALDWVPRAGRSLLNGGFPTSSGSTVNQNTVMSLSAVWAGVNFYATVLGSLPLHLYEKTKNGKGKAVSHPVYDILQSVANPEMVAMTYRENIVWSILLLGKSYSEKVYNGHDNLAELWPIPAYRVDVKRDTKGLKYYEVRIGDKPPVELYPDSVLEIVGAYGGASILNLLKESLGLSMSLNEYAALFFGGGTHPGVVVSHPKSLGATAHENLKNSLVDKYSGLGKSHKLLLLDEAMKIEKIGHSPEDAQAIESRVFQISEVARILNLPPHILRELSKSSFNNIEQQSLETVIYSLAPMAIRIEQHLNAQLLSRAERKKYFFKHNLEGLLRGDTESRSNFYWKMFQMGAYSINDILGLENRNTIGKEGDSRFVMANMLPIDKIDDFYSSRAIENSAEKRTFLEKIEVRASDADDDEIQNEQIKKRDAIKDRMRPLFKKDIQRVVNKEVKAIDSNYKKKNSEDFETWLNEFYEKMPEYISDNVGDTFRAFASAMKEAVLLEIEQEEIDIDEDIEAFVVGFAKRYSDDARGQILALLNEDSEKIPTRTEEWSEKKADKQAFRQTVGLTGMVASSVILGSSMGLKWATRGKSCPYCNQLNGKIIKSKTEFFVDRGTVLDGGEGEKMTVINRTKYPQLHRGCDCNVVAA